MTPPVDTFPPADADWRGIAACLANAALLLVRSVNQHQAGFHVPPDVLAGRVSTVEHFLDKWRQAESDERQRSQTA
jgi:hypothetical protein